jgi:hypothetical protein
MRIALALLLSACSAQAVFAADAADTRASEASVRQLFEVMHTSSMLDALMAQIDNSARTSMSQAVAGQPLNERSSSKTPPRSSRRPQARSVLADVAEIDAERAEFAVQVRALHADALGQLPDLAVAEQQLLL